VLAIEQPAFGQVRVANELLRRGISVSPPEPAKGGIRPSRPLLLWQNVNANLP